MNVENTLIYTRARRNPVAKTVRSPMFRMRVISAKNKYSRKDKNWKRDVSY